MFLLSNGKPEMINTDQGSQFTCETFSEYVTSQLDQVSMDGKGRLLTMPLLKDYGEV